MSDYGSVEWFESQYGRTSSDPWGLDWRPTQLYRYASMIAALRSCLQQRGLRADSVLDVGCATGDFTDLLRRLLPESAERKVAGVDLSPTAVERAARRHPHVQFHTGAIDELQSLFPGDLELISCLEVLYYLPAEKRQSALEVLHSLLRPGGLLLVSTMIGKGQYMNLEQLRALVGRRFSLVGGGCLTLWPLVALEKTLLKLTRSAPKTSMERFLPGQPGFNRMRRLAGACSVMFGTKAASHAYVLAIRE